MEKDKRQGSYFHILKYTSVFGGVQGLNVFIGLVRNKLVALILGPGGMGLVALFNATIKLVSDITNLGIPTSAVKDISAAHEQGNRERERELVGTVRTWSLLTAMVGTLLCAVLSPLLNKFTFTWGNHTLHFVLLSPIVGMMAVTGGEMAILKGCRQLRSLAKISIVNLLLALFTSVPIYYLWGYAGIVPSLVLIALVQMATAIGRSWRLFPPRWRHVGLSKATPGSARSRVLKDMADGRGMVKLGLAFVASGCFVSGADFLIRSFLNTSGSLEVVGLYNAGYMMTMTYAGIVFSSMDSDYFPRLSGLQKAGGRALSVTVNRQIEVTLLLLAPLLTFFIVFMPVLLPLLYSTQFAPVVSMAKLTAFAMYMRAVYLPIEYLSLARGDSRTFMLQDFVASALLVAGVVAGWYCLELEGTGIGISLAALVETAFVAVLAYKRFDYKISGQVVALWSAQLSIGVLAFLITLVSNAAIYWALGIALTAMSAVLSFVIIKRRTPLS